MDELRCVLLEAGEDNTLTMAATNMEVALERRMQAQVREGGSLLMGAKLFVGMLSLLGGETVTIQGEDGRQAQIASGTCCYTIPLLPVSRYPRMEIPFPEDTVAVSNIPHMAARTVFAAAESESKPAMQCVKLTFTSDGLKAVSYDGSRLAAAKGDSKGNASVSMLMPAASLNKLARLVSNKDELDVGTTGKSVVFTKENFMFSARLLKGQHVDSDLLLGSVQSAFTILTDAAALYDAVSGVSVVADEDSALSLCFADNRIQVRCEGEGCSSSRELEVVALSGTPEGKYWYNPRQLAQCLGALGGTLMLEIGQNGVLILRTDDLVCLQMARRKPARLRVLEEKPEKKAAKAAA
ncbi:DNA polymerase III beta subunit [Intestinimonas butyriciproducens]|uniref:DNA polymerase III subunit beta n=2 Tax=Intestinimonas butyriciproducens TaxID=1297617 RepID=A0A0S2W4V2_9FIRM|nr:hypothetical protein [Intestinimonas butyriciproducens]ALP94347.1 DNA polymerase III beta subunit [Intestinimonas butyriciproducens]